MEIKILQVFYDKNGLPYKDKERTVHYPITSGTFLGASNTTQIRFYYDQLDELNESTFVAVSKLPNGKIGSEILENEYDSELEENYAVLNLSQFYTQYKGDVYISLQGYQGGIRVEQDEDGIYQIYGTPTIQATGSIKLSIAYAPTFIGSGQTENITLQRVLAELSTKLGIRQETLYVEELPTVGNPNVWYVINDDPNDTNKANIYIWNATTQTYMWVGDNTLDLGNYYTQEEGQEFESEIDNRVTSVENELSSVASGSPKGVYATLAALQAAFPTGTNGIYVVSADGHWYYWNGSAWTDGGAYLSTANAVPTTRTIAGIDLVDNITQNELNDALSLLVPISCGGSIDASSGKWQTIVGTQYYGGLIDVSKHKGMFIEITANDNNACAYTFLTEDNVIAQDELPVYAKGYNTPIADNSQTINAGESKSIEIPQNAKWLYAYMNSAGTIYTPKEIKLYSSVNLDLSNELLLNDSAYNIDFRKINAVITRTDGWLVGESLYNCYLADISNFKGKEILIIANDDKKCPFTFLKTINIVGGATPDYAEGFSNPSSNTLLMGHHQYVTVPEDANYLYILRHSEPNDYGFKQVSVTQKSAIEKIVESFGVELSLNPLSGSIATATGQWQTDPQYYGGIIDIEQYRGKIIKITANGNNACAYTFIKQLNFGAGLTPVYSGLYSQPIAANNLIIEVDESKYITVPSDAKYLYAYMASANVICTPKEILVFDLEKQNEKINSIENISASEGIDLCTYNIGHFSLGSLPNSTITSSNYASKLAQFKELIYKNINADILGLCEYSAVFGNDGNANQSAKDVLFYDYQEDYIGVQRNYSCNALYSYLEVQNITLNEFQCLANETITHTTAIEATDYYYLECDLKLKGRTIKLVMTHFAFDNNRPNVLQSAEIAELVEKYSSYDRVVIMGDLNTEDATTLNAFINAGYSVANTGQYLTYRTTGKALDNIVVKGLKMSNVKMIDSDLSDHNPLCATISIK